MVSLRRRRLMGFTVGAAPDLPDNLHLPEDALPRTEPVAANPAPTGNEAPPAVNRNPPDQAAPHGPNPATTVITIPMDEFDETKLVIDLNIPADAPPSIEPASINQAPSVNEQQPTSEVCIHCHPYLILSELGIGLELEREVNEPQMAKLFNSSA
ncbi:hypothetical protein Ancab_012244 [Ancistrocladus abbreviatus]